MKKIIQSIFSRPFWQPSFERLLNLTLKILNVGEGQSVETSGEKSVFKILEHVTPRRDSAIVFDVGAHTGEWLTMFRSSYPHAAIVHSFEPSHESYAELSKITEKLRHNTSMSLAAHNLAFGETEGTATLSGDSIGSSGAQIRNSTLASASADPTETITIKTIDQFCSENAIDHIDLLKLDIEGYELRALAGAKDMLANNAIKLIQFEYGAPSDQKYSLRELFDLLSNTHTICRVLQHGYYPLPTYRHFYEIMTVTNFIAIRKDLQHSS